MNEAGPLVETARSARETADLFEGLGDDVRADELRRVADELDPPDPDEALAKALHTELYRDEPDVYVWELVSRFRRRAWVRMARAARAHIAAESPQATVTNTDSVSDVEALRRVLSGEATPDAEPWKPWPGKWAQITNEAHEEREDLPQVPRVLIVRVGTDVCEVVWPGRADRHGRVWRTVLKKYLAPVTPRVWDRAEDVPPHVVVRDKDGGVYSGYNARSMGDVYAPYTEVMEGEA
ncbi:hypothetical protein [Tomitella gaofuii]|uniref:hypothetical protein n=1 Tax=Tomitella gaofuii TaxID=2760083 RepID=UPI0015FA6158|nr:hypothetical protein [Tomitella gaofuii]